MSTEITSENNPPDDGGVAAPSAPPSPAYEAFQRGDYAAAAALLSSSDTSGDPIDLPRALALDPAQPVTAIVLAIIWISLVVTVL